MCSSSSWVKQRHGKRRRLVETLRSTMADYGLAPLLRHRDRNSMRWNIESRVPFLTIDMAQFLLSLPESYLLSRQGETKHIFRAAMQGIVPGKILQRRDKIGFQTPERQWLMKRKKSIDNWLDPADGLPFLNGRVFREEINDILDARQAFSFQAWRFINYCRWVQWQEDFV